MKTLVTIVSAVALSLAGTYALAQSTQATQPDTSATAPVKKDAKTKKKEDFAAKERAMQEASKSSASGHVAPTAEERQAAKNRPSAKSAMQQQMELEANEPSPKVDKNAKAAGPRPNASKMTQKERDEYRKEVVKEAKP